MCLTRLIRDPELKPLLDGVSPEYPRNLRAVRRVESTASSRDAATVGTAFDYALRIELQRLAELYGYRLSARPWHIRAMRHVARYESLLERGAGEPSWPCVRDVEKALYAARLFELDYISRQSVTSNRIAELARHCSVLASFDAVHRAGPRALPFRLVPSPEVCSDVARLLAHVPFATLLSEDSVVLNPVFGVASREVGGADADLVLGDLLVEVKTTRECLVERELMRQLVGYALLSRVQRWKDPAAPEVRRIGVYFARHAHLHVFEPLPGPDKKLDAVARKMLRLAANRRRVPPFDARVAGLPA